LLAISCFAGGFVLSRDYERVWPWLRPSLANGEPFPQRLIVFVNGLLAINMYLAGMLIAAFLLGVIAFRNRRVSAGGFVRYTAALVVVPLTVSAFLFERHGSSESAYSREGLISRYVRVASSEFNASQDRFLVPDPHHSFVVPTHVRQKLGSDRGAGSRYVAVLGLHNTALVQGVASAHGFEGAAINDYLVLLTLATQRSGLAAKAPAVGVGSDLPLARFAALTASKIVLESGAAVNAAPKLNLELFPVVMHDRDLEARLYKPAAIRPRWYLSHHVECVADPNQFLQRFLDPNPHAMEASSHAAFVVRSEINRRQEALCSLRLTPGESTADRVELIEDRSEVLGWTVATDRDSLFVVADQYYAGWEATVDGKPVSIVRTNLINRGVWVPSGKHIVRMEYRPKSFRNGLWIASMALFGILASGLCATIVSGRTRAR
jgi:hypothetical protein